MRYNQTTNFRADGIFPADEGGDDCCYIECLDENGEGTEEYISIGECPHCYAKKRQFRLILQVADSKLLLPANVDLSRLFEIAKILRHSELLNTTYDYDTHQTKYSVKPHLGTVDISLISEAELAYATSDDKTV